MSATRGLTGRARRVMLPAIGIASVVSGVLAQYAPSRVLALRTATTGELLAILALLFLPAVTIAAVVLDRNVRSRRTRAGVARSPAPEPVPPTSTASDDSRRIGVPRAVPTRVVMVIESKPLHQTLTVSVPRNRAA